MIGRDLHNTLSYQRAISPLTQTNSDTAFVSQIIDMADLLGLEFVIALGNMTDANMTAVVLIEESEASDMTGANAVADADLLPAPNNTVATAPEAQAGFTFSDDNAIKSIGYVGTKRYVRMTITPTGNDAGALPIAAIAVGLPRLRANVNGS